MKGSGTTYLRGSSVNIGSNGGSGGFYSNIYVHGPTATSRVEMTYGGSKKFETESTGVAIHEDTDKVIRFTGEIGDIGSVTGFQATNTAANALTSFGIRATDIRLATGSDERV